MKKTFAGIAAAAALAAADAAPTWPADLPEVMITSSIDATPQPAMFYLPPEAATQAVPLLVGLHTWSFDHRGPGLEFLQFARERGWAFIYPKFRGANNTPEACGSDLAVQDVVDAVNYACRQGRIDSDRIYLVGYSGGGHMALLMAARHPEIWAAVSCSVPIVDLARWHRESGERGNGYGRMMERAIGGAPGASAAVDAAYRHRSPATFLPEIGGKVKLDILAGIHDGHTGSVPISHALEAFNLVARPSDRLTPEQIAFMTAKRAVPPELAGEWRDPEYGAQRVHFRRTSDTARITIFEGGHQAVPYAMLSFLARQRRTGKVDFAVPAAAAAAAGFDGRVSH